MTMRTTTSAVVRSVRRHGHNRHNAFHLAVAIVSSRSWWALSAAACLVLAGCGDGRPTRVPVSGQVLIDGQPLTHGNVRFVPQHGRVSTGKLDSDGHFVLTCFENGDGAIVGRHRVAVVAAEQINDEQMQWFAPKKYAHYGTSNLEEEINGPTDSVTINLTWDGGQPFVEGTRTAQDQQLIDDE